MEASEIKPIVEQALRDPQNFPFRVYVIIGLVTVISVFVGAFFIRLGQVFAESKHAKSLEKLAQTNREVIELMSQKHQLRLAALDQRLKAHQQAFMHWRNLCSALHSDKITSVVTECQDWWNSNCLYLDAKAREAFIRACVAANEHESLKKGFLVKSVTSEEIKENVSVIRAPGIAIVQGVALPPIKDFDVADIP